jgi:hypothetical protein
MPRRSKGARLWLRPGRRDGSGKCLRRATSIILDGDNYIATGCPASEIAAARIKLSGYIAEKYQPDRRERDIEEIDIADVLWIYDNDRGPGQANRTKLDARLERLNEFWGARKLSEVTGDTCREYVRWRKSPGGARRDLEDLRSAINHHAKEGLHRGIVHVVAPAKGTCP